jgi:hypothetical protein
MNDKVLIGIIVGIVLGAHLWLFLWIKFKIQEGSIIKSLKEVKDNNCRGEENISLDTGIAVTRVVTICTKSNLIKSSAMAKGSWCLI